MVKVRVFEGGKIKVKLKPEQGVKVGTDTTYLYDPTIIEAEVQQAKDWAIKTDGMVEEDGELVDYSAKAYAVGGTGTETNNSKYYSEQAGLSATSASDSATTATTQAGVATTQAGIATTQAGTATTQAGIATTKASEASASATTATTQAGIATTQAGIATTKAGEASTSATNAHTSELGASGYASSASTSATNAGISETNAQTWAEGTDEQVSVLGGEKSSKGWTQRAKEIVDSIGTVLHYKGSVATYNDLPSSGQEVGDMYNVIDTGNNYVWAGTGWDEISGIVDLSPYRKASDQDTIDAGKVDKVTTASKVYGTDASGNQTTYDKDSFGQVDDVKVNGTSVVSNKVANVTVPTDTSDLTNGAGYITGITSSDVTTALGYTPYDDSNPDGYITGITSSDVTTALGYSPVNPTALANVATSGSYNDLSNKPTIPTVNNPTITITQGGVTKGSFTLNQSSGDTIALDAGGGSSVDIDSLSITKNGDDEIQTIGVINQNNTSTALKQWSGTKAQYDAIATKDANTVYNITDDTNPTQALLEAIYPVGAIYIGTMSVCPLSALFGTWQLVAQDRVLQGAGTRGAVGTTINESLPNIKGTMGGTVCLGNMEEGALYKSPGAGAGIYGNVSATSGFSSVYGINASRSSSTYQDSAPVQQDAYLVNIWQRIS